MADFFNNIILPNKLKKNRKNSYEINQKNSITPIYIKRKFDIITSRFDKIEFKVIFIGISGGQASGKKKISEYFKNNIGACSTICEISFLKEGEKERKISKEDEYLIKDYKFYSKERRLYLIDKCNPDCYDYDKFYETLKNLRDGKSVKIPYFDEKEFRFNHEKDRIIDPEKTPIIIIDGYFIFRNKEVRDLLNLKIYKDIEDDYIRLSRLVLREEKILNGNPQAYDLFFAIYEKFYKTSYDEYIVTHKNFANIVLPDYNIDENNEIEVDVTLEFILSILRNLINKKSK